MPLVSVVTRVYPEREVREVEAHVVRCSAVYGAHPRRYIWELALTPRGIYARPLGSREPYASVAEDGGITLAMDDTLTVEESAIRSALAADAAQLGLPLDLSIDRTDSHASADVSTRHRKRNR